MTVIDCDVERDDVLLVIEDRKATARRLQLLIVHAFLSLLCPFLPFISPLVAFLLPSLHYCG